MNPPYRLIERCLLRERIADLSLNDSRQVEAALAWIELGNPQEAETELQSISVHCRNHPRVFRARYLIHEARGEWERAAAIARIIRERFPRSSYGFNQLAYALHQLQRTEEAYNVLLPAAIRFPKEDSIPYNLACYSCRLGNIEVAWTWLQKAVELAGTEQIKTQAMSDPDLERLWPRISEW
ncbi:MAG TPA: tetratricopeptide repeat protein [Verrucomicrobiae bacterium]|nr:tetratricopeptide repeat protein [Verrucomicrobiae bacterium]